MPTRFLTNEQRYTFGRFTGSPSPEQLARHFHLDTLELTTVQKLRGPANRLGFAVLLCAVRYIGTFPSRCQDVPDVVITFLASQLECGCPPDLSGYFDSASRTYKRHTAPGESTERYCRIIFSMYTPSPELT